VIDYAARNRWYSFDIGANVPVTGAVIVTTPQDVAWPMQKSDRDVWPGPD
jgi:hypothetical protein